MNKTELIKEISRLTGISSNKTSRIIDSLLKIITETVKEGDKVSLHRFGAFHMATNASRLAYNISTGSIERRPATKRLKFEPSKDFKKSVKEQVQKIVTTINESIKIEYGGTVSTNKFLGIFEHDTYPSFKTPRLGATILKPQQISQKPIIGYTEPLMLEELRKLCEINTELKIIDNVGIPISGCHWQFVPDFVLYHERVNLYIDIEIDEPYVMESRKPIHCIDGRDIERDKYIINNGWVIIRYSERQVYKHLDETIKDLQSKISWLIDDDVCPSSLLSDNRWTHDEAKILAKENYREQYLGVSITKENLIAENHTYEWYADSHQLETETNQENITDNNQEILINQIDYIKNVLCPKYVKVNLKDSRQFILNGESFRLDNSGKEISGICPYGDICRRTISRLDTIEKIECINSLYTNISWTIKKDKFSYLLAILIDASINGSPIWVKYKTKGGIQETYIRYPYLSSLKQYGNLIMPNYSTPFTDIGKFDGSLCFYLQGLYPNNIEDYDILEIKVINCIRDFHSINVYENSLRTLICKEHKYEDDWKCIDYLIGNKERFHIDDSVYQQLIDKYEKEKVNGNDEC